MTPAARDPLIVALDTDEVGAARALAGRLGDSVGFYKIGLGLLGRGGLDLAGELAAAGNRVFLDLKLFDIAATIRAAVAGLAGPGVDLLTVHGDPHVVEAAVVGRGARETRILAVTVLTSLDRGDLDAAGYKAGALPDLVLERAVAAFAAGADGVVASPREAGSIRRLPEAAGKLIVTPGVRPHAAAAHDQKRVATPAEAVAAGADHLVVGRPVTGAEDPAAAVAAIREELRNR